MRPRIAVLLVALAIFAVHNPEAHAQTSGDTTDVLRAVVASLKKQEAHEDSLRAEYCASGRASSCRRLVPIWYVKEESRVIRELATVQGNRLAVDSLGERPPVCAWPSESAPVNAGFRTRSELRFATADSAFVILSHTCDNPRGYLHDIYMLGFKLWIRRERAWWRVLDFVIAVT